MPGIEKAKSQEDPEARLNKIYHEVIDTWDVDCGALGSAEEVGSGEEEDVVMEGEVKCALCDGGSDGGSDGVTGGPAGAQMKSPARWARGVLESPHRPEGGLCAMMQGVFCPRGELESSAASAAEGEPAQEMLRSAPKMGDEPSGEDLGNCLVAMHKLSR